MSKATEAWNHPDWKQAAKDVAAEVTPRLPAVTDFKDFEDACRMVDERNRLDQLQRMFGRKKCWVSK